MFRFLLPLQRAEPEQADPIADYTPVPERAGDEVLQKVNAVIPLDRALLCLDCESIYLQQSRRDANSLRCPACGSTIAWAMGGALNRPTIGGMPHAS